MDEIWTCSRDYPISNDGDNENNVIDIAYESNDGGILSAIHRILSDHGTLAQQESWRLHASLKRLEPCNEDCIVNDV